MGDGLFSPRRPAPRAGRVGLGPGLEDQPPRIKPPLIAFANRLKTYLPGILADCRWPLHTSLLEGINNKIKVIKRMAYGFRDDEYVCLKIRAAFPGNR